MQNHIVRIDHIHSRAICDEVADRLRIVLPNDLADAPGFSEKPNPPPTGTGSIAVDSSFNRQTKVFLTTSRIGFC